MSLEPHYKVSIIAPCYNEIYFIEDFIKNIYDQELKSIDLNIIIADGDSNDGTRNKLDQLKGRYDNLFIINNSERIVSTGLNKAMLLSNSDILIRMDIHTIYDKFYINNCVHELIKNKADNIGGAWRSSESSNFIQTCINNSFKSKIGTGGAKAKNYHYDGEVDTVYLGCWWRKNLIAIGGFDENFVRNQDDELCLRMKKLGQKVYQSPKIISYYSNRTSFLKLFKQYYQYGFWKPAVMKKHNQPASIRHLVPGLFVLFLIFLSITSLIFNSLLLVYFYLVYCLFVIFFFSIERKFEDNFLILLGSCFGIYLMHLSYGLGYLRGCLSFFFGYHKNHINKNITR